MSGPRIPRPFSPTNAKRERDELAREAERSEGALWAANYSAAGRLADTQAQIDSLNEQVPAIAEELGSVDGKIAAAIDDSLAQPITADRFTENSLDVWPFIHGTVPQGALAPGSVGTDEIADFSIAAKKLKTNRHYLY